MFSSCTNSIRRPVLARVAHCTINQNLGFCGAKTWFYQALVLPMKDWYPNKRICEVIYYRHSPQGMQRPLRRLLCKATLLKHLSGTAASRSCDKAFVVPWWASALQGSPLTTACHFSGFFEDTPYVLHQPAAGPGRALPEGPQKADPCPKTDS